MQEKRKQSAAIAVAATLGMLPIISPIAVYAQEEKKEEQALIQSNTTQIKEKAPALELPKNLTGKEGQPLQEIALPENWSWTKEATQISKDKAKYPARITVNDVLYDYSDVEGYNADGHYVECNLTIVVNEQVSVIEHTESEPQVTTINTNIIHKEASTPKSNDIDINDQTFPDQTFREWVIANVAGADDKILTPDEISKITDIDLSNYSDKGKIISLQGIGYFSELVNLNVRGSAVNATSLESLDVSKNTKLETLDCAGNKNLTTLTVKGASALKELSCSITGITSLDVSNNTALTTLYCSSTGITSLNVNNNKNLTKLYCHSNTNLKSLTIQGAAALQSLYCYDTSITSLDVSNNKALTYLDCHTNVSLKSLTVKGAIALENLICDSTGITSLDVSNNEALTILNCERTGITSLDVSNNEALTTLLCSKTGITSLDVSINTNLQELYCNESPLAYLNIGTNNDLNIIKKNNLKPVNIEVTGGSFNIADKLAGIDINKISSSSVKGATYSNGILSNYNKGVPITYTYAIGTSANGTETIDVTLNLIFKSSITITDDLNKTYDGKAIISTPTVSKSGSTGAISYKWERKKDTGQWEDITSAPADAGTYRVTAKLASDSNFPDATSEPKEFTISQADSTIVVSANLDQTYDGTAVSTFPSITKTGSTGTVSYLWEQKKSTNNWEIIATAPSDAGTYRVTATLASDKNYEGATSEPKEFAISQADSSVSVMDDLSKTYDGKTVHATPTVSTTGSNGAVSFKWEKKVNDTDWEDIATGPSDTGTYRVTAILASDKNYKGVISAPYEFAISQADSSVSVTSDLNKTYDGKTVNAIPVVSITGSNGAVSYQWEKKVDDTKWEIIATAPSDAGTYRVTAILASDKNYKGAISAPYEFTISQAVSTISVTEDMNKTYDKNSVNATPVVSTTGSNGAVSFKWEKKVDDTKWEIIATAPSDAGTYRVTATLASDNNYKGAISAPYEFTISQASNSWIDSLAITGWTYGEHPSKPTAKASFGDSIYTYSDSKYGAYVDTIPMHAGTWYVKATIAGTDNYTGLETTLAFTVSPKSVDHNSQIVISDIHSDKDVEELIVKDGDKMLVKGTDYIVDKIQKEETVEVTITFKGNYTGTLTKSYTIKQEEIKEKEKETGNGIVAAGGIAQTGFFTILSLLPAGCIAMLNDKKRNKDKN